MHEDLSIAYQATDLPCIQLGGIKLENALLPDAPIHIVLKSFNRHGLIAGATGSGKTKTIQVLSEQLSLMGVPSLVMDMKGDISGLAFPGEATELLMARSESLHLSFQPKGFPVEYLCLNEHEMGVPLRSSLKDLGPLLFARMLDLNETQESVLTIVFEFAKQAEIPLVDLIDCKQLLQYIQTEQGKEHIEKQYGAISSSTLGILIRKIIEIEAQGGQAVFGEPAFQCIDLIKTNPQGLGVISILRLQDMQDRPKVFSSFMLKLLSDLYKKMPELGDPDKPKLMLFIDEAHLIFNNASKPLLDLMETMVKLIRSKGIGLIFCTQTPNDIPESVLSQLGLKVQHTLRAFTAKDRKAMKLVAQNFPTSEYYDTETLLTSLGIGEALVCALNAKGQPTPLVQCVVRPPESRMGTVSVSEMQSVMNVSRLFPLYKDKLKSSNRLSETIRTQATHSNEEQSTSSTDPSKVTSIITSVTKNTLFRQIVRQLFRDAMRGIMNMLNGKKK